MRELCIDFKQSLYNCVSLNRFISIESTELPPKNGLFDGINKPPSGLLYGLCPIDELEKSNKQNEKITIQQNHLHT